MNNVDLKKFDLALDYIGRAMEQLDGISDVNKQDIRHFATIRNLKGAACTIKSMKLMDDNQVQELSFMELVNSDTSYLGSFIKELNAKQDNPSLQIAKFRREYINSAANSSQMRDDVYYYLVMANGNVIIKRDYFKSPKMPKPVGVSNCQIEG
jgi:hypothetical protein